MFKLSQTSYANGENSRDNPEELNGEQVQTLVNCYPVHPDPRPREGIGVYNKIPWPDIVRYMIPYRDDVVPEGSTDFNRDKVIAICGRDIYWTQAGNSDPVLIAEDIITTEDPVFFAHERFFDTIYVVTDNEDVPNFIIEWNGAINNFEIRSTFIEYESIFQLGITYFWTSGNSKGLSDKHYRYAITQVNLDPLTGSQYAYNSGKLESPANLNDTLAFDFTGEPLYMNVTFGAPNQPTDPQVTHIRIYRTVGWDTAEDAFTAAQAGEMQYIGDIEIGDTFVDNVTDAELGGETNTIAQQIGLDPMPSATDILYHNGLMWISPSDRSERGKWYYSNPIVDAVQPLKYLSYYNYLERFIETSLDNSEKNTALGVAGNDLYYFMEESVWFLRDGDPTFGPRKVNNTQGSQFPNSFFNIDNKVFYLSNDGPAFVQDQKVSIISSYSCKELWPATHYGVGDFFTLNQAPNGTEDKRNVISFYHKNCWFLSYRDTTLAYYMPHDKRSIGSWRCVIANPKIRIGAFAILDLDTCVISGKGDYTYGKTCDLGGATTKTIDNRAYTFLDDSVNYDDMVFYKLSSLSRVIHVNPERDYSAEVFSLKTYARFTDLGEFRFVITADYARRQISFLYDEREKSDALQNQTINDKPTGALQSKTKWRTVLQQGVPEGLIGRHFEVEWEKNYLPPYDFKLVGFDLECIARPEQPMEFVSYDEGIQILPLDTLIHARVKQHEPKTGLGWVSITDIDQGYGILTVRGENYE